MRAFVHVLLTFMFLSLMGCEKHAPVSPDPRTLEWILTSGESVKFSHENPGFGSDHAKFLDVRFSDGQSRRYSFGESHSGYNRVELRMDVSQNHIWLIDCDNGKLGAFLDLPARRFKGEGQGPPLPPGTIFLKPR